MANLQYNFPVIFYLQSFCPQLACSCDLYIYHWVSSMFSLCICCIFWWRHCEDRDRILFYLQAMDESYLPLWFSCWMGVRRLKYCLLSTRIIILPTSLSKLTGEKEHKMKLKMFVLSLERRWKLHNFSLLPFTSPEVRLGQHLQFKLLFPEVNNSAVRLQSQFNIWQSCCLEIIPLVHIYNTFSQRVLKRFNTMNCIMVCFIHHRNAATFEVRYSLRMQRSM